MDYIVPFLIVGFIIFIYYYYPFRSIEMMQPVTMTVPTKTACPVCNCSCPKLMNGCTTEGAEKIKVLVYFIMHLMGKTTRNDILIQEATNLLRNSPDTPQMGRYVNDFISQLEKQKGVILPRL